MPYWGYEPYYYPYQNYGFYGNDYAYGYSGFYGNYGYGSGNNIGYGLFVVGIILLLILGGGYYYYKCH